MNEFEQQIRIKARQLLREKKVDLIIGYSKGSISFRTRPIFLNKEESVEKLVWNSYCSLNLAKFLPSINKDLKIGIIAKGCTGRSIIQLALENQINRDNITIIGIECSGNINRRKIEDIINNQEILDVIEKDNKIIIKGKDFEEIISKSDYLNNSCKTCKVRIHPLSDIIIGEISPIAINNNDDYEDLKEFDEKSPDEKWEIITKILSNCIRCYSCREACPMCYCNQCFIDQIKPIWFDKTTELSDIIIFHIVRAFHVAGRCTSCGDCTNSCPMGIDLTLITRELEKVVKNRYDFISGIDPEKPIPFGSCSINDNEDFMIHK
ncbi:MAG: 4Fe-4S ferredoxin [Candidatus Lokiarchaeota archaeon]|nr:4Fe-4S ferredoxin [Candidatus Lokiarchaeota archaeon]